MSAGRLLWDKSLLSLTDSSGKMNLFSLALPLFLQQVFTILLGTVNTVVLTTVSDDAVTAVNIAATVLNIPIMLLTMPSNGAMILLCLALGEGKRKTVSTLYCTGLAVTIFLSVCVSALFFVLAPSLLRRMQLSDTVLSAGILYFRIRCVFLLFQALTTYLTSVLRTHGMAKATMISGILVNIVNALLSIMAVNGLLFGNNKLVGVSLAAGLSQLVGMGYAIGVLYKKQCIAKGGSLLLSQTMRILKIGIPSGLSLLAYHISTILVTAMIASLGNQAVNTKVFVTNIANYTYLFGFSVAQSGALMTGRLCGAGEISHAKQLFRQNIVFVPAVNVCLSILVCIFSGQLMRIFTDDPAMIQTARYLFLADIFVEAFRGITHVGENALCSVEDTLFTAAISTISCFFISVLFCWLFCIHFKLGLLGYYLAAIIDEGSRGLCYRLRWNRGRWALRFRKSNTS